MTFTFLTLVRGASQDRNASRVPAKSRALAALCPLLLLAGHATAQSPAAAPAQAPASAQRMLSRDELRVCMKSGAELATRRTGMEGRNARTRDEAAAIRAEGQQLAADQKALSTQDRAQVEAFNQRADAYNARVQAAKASIEAITADQLALNAAVLAYNEQCGNATSRQADRDAIEKELAPAK